MVTFYRLTKPLQLIMLAQHSNLSYQLKGFKYELTVFGGFQLANVIYCKGQPTPTQNWGLLQTDSALCLTFIASKAWTTPQIKPPGKIKTQIFVYIYIYI